MKLLYFKGSHGNFGDDLNRWLFPQIFPNFFNDDDSEVFLGIGSTIGADFVHGLGTNTRKIVFGAGFVPAYNPSPNYNVVPDVHKSDWEIYFVRGPRTARALNISAELAVGDSALLIRNLVDVKSRDPKFITFMPHWESMERGNWQEVCDLAGIKLIDPRGPVDSIIQDLMSSKLVIAEAMHGAIVADALRIPWIPIMPMNKIHRNKWYDWAEALNFELSPKRIFPTSLVEARLSFMRIPLVNSPFANITEKCLIHAAAFSLNRVARMTPCLTSDYAMNLACEKMNNIVKELLHI